MKTGVAIPIIIIFWIGFVFILIQTESNHENYLNKQYKYTIEYEVTKYGFTSKVYCNNYTIDKLGCVHTDSGIICGDFKITINH